MLENISAAMDLEELKNQFEKLEKKSRRAELLLSVNREGLRFNRPQHYFVQHYR